MCYQTLDVFAVDAVQCLLLFLLHSERPQLVPVELRLYLCDAVFAHFLFQHVVPGFLWKEGGGGGGRGGDACRHNAECIERVPAIA